VLLEKQQWMSVIAQIMLLTIDIAQQTSRRFLFNVDVHFFVQRKVCFFTGEKFLLLGL